MQIGRIHFYQPLDAESLVGGLMYGDLIHLEEELVQFHLETGPLCSM